MTHSLHREGSAESLKDDFCLLAYCTKGINDKGAYQKLLQIIDILQNNGLANLGVPAARKSTRAGLTLTEIREMLEKKGIPRFWSCVPGEENIQAVLGALKKGDFGLSITVSGLIDTIMEISKKLDIQPHTISLSGGIHGKTKQLPVPEILEVTTMCGHAMVPANLVEKVIWDIKRGKQTYREGALELSRPCHCGIFNPVRAERLLRRLVPLMTLDG
jgi:hypothetical protein